MRGQWCQKKLNLFLREVEGDVKWRFGNRLKGVVDVGIVVVIDENDGAGTIGRFLSYMSRSMTMGCAGAGSGAKADVLQRTEGRRQ